MLTSIRSIFSRFLESHRTPKLKCSFQRHEVLLIVFGEGGHSMAMKRVMQLLKLDNTPIVQLRELGSHKFPDYVDHKVHRIMPKRSGKIRLIMVPFRVLENLFVVLQLFVRYRVRFVLTTGPIIAVFPCLIAKIIGVPCVFIESWARFTSISRTGKFLMAIGTLVFYQNWELSPLIRKGRYCGRL